MQKKKRNIISLLTISAITVLMVLSVFIWNKPYTYVGLDGQSSIGLTLNVFNRIIKAESIGKGSDLLKNEELKKQLNNKSINEGILSALDVMEQMVSFDHKIDDVLIISVWTKDMKESEKVKVQLQNIASIYVEQIGYSVDIQGLVLTDEAFEIAFNSGISPARYQILQRIRTALNNQIAMEELQNQTPQIEFLANVVAPRSKTVIVNQPKVDYVTIPSPKSDDEHYIIKDVNDDEIDDD